MAYSPFTDQNYPKKYKDNKGYPVLASETSNLLRRTEPLLKPKQLVSRYLKGIDLSDYDTDDLKDKIHLAINEAELLVDTTFTPVKRTEKYPFDYNLYKKFIHIMTSFGPVLEVHSLSIQSSNNQEIFLIPADWIEAARFYQRQINVVPLTVIGATGLSSGQPTGAAGLAFIAAMNSGLNWVPSYWEITYTTGMCHKEGYVPVMVNELIGAIAAIEILGNIGATNINTSVSVSHDGISQSSSNPGPSVYQTRIGELTAKKDDLVKKLRRVIYSKYFVSNV